MDDQKLIELYWMRDEDAIRETAVKYGKLCTYIAKNILKNIEDCEECVNDAYLAVWNAIPTQRPNRFAAFISRITRNLDELGDCVSNEYRVESEVEKRHIEQTINIFLGKQSAEKRNIFIRRYWHFDSIDSICKLTGFSQSKVKSILYEMRLKLRKYLESEGIEV